MSIGGPPGRRNLEPLLKTIVYDQSKSALEKLQSYFATAVTWKTEQKELMLELMRIWYADENMIVRQKLSAKTLEQITPLLTEIIWQGVREGVFNTQYPEFVSQVNFYLLQGLSDRFVEIILSNTGEPDEVQKADGLIAAYNDALERVLGAPKNSIHVMDRKSLEIWFSN